MCKFAFLFMQKFLFIAVILFPAISNLHAAIYLNEDYNNIKTLEFHFDKPYQLINSEKTISATKKKKQINPSRSLDKQSTSEINEKPKSDIKDPDISAEKQSNHTIQPPGLSEQSPSDIIETPSLTTTKPSGPANFNVVLESINLSIQKIINSNGGELNELLNEETIDDVTLIIKDINLNMNQLNLKIEQKISPAIEEILFMQQLFSTSGGDQDQFTQFDQHTQTANTYSDNNPYNSPKLENIPYEEPEGFLGLLFKLPKYLFNLKNIIIVIVFIFFMTGIFKALHFALNNIY